MATQPGGAIRRGRRIVLRRPRWGRDRRDLGTARWSGCSLLLAVSPTPLRPTFGWCTGQRAEAVFGNPLRRADTTWRPAWRCATDEPRSPSGVSGAESSLTSPGHTAIPQRSMSRVTDDGLNASAIGVDVQRTFVPPITHFRCNRINP